MDAWRVRGLGLPLHIADTGKKRPGKQSVLVFWGCGGRKDHKLRARRLLVAEAEIKVGRGWFPGRQRGGALQAALPASGLPCASALCVSAVRVWLCVQIPPFHEDATTLD